MGKYRIGLYPGTFDPITNGHLDIIFRATKLCDQLVVGVAHNEGKGPLFPVEERVAMVREDIAAMDTNGIAVTVEPFNNLLMNYAVSLNASMIIRGLRAVSDFEYEFQMAGMNARLNPVIETVFLMSADRHQFISSRFVKEVGRLGGDISHFVSPRVAKHLMTRFVEMQGASGTAV